MIKDISNFNSPYFRSEEPQNKLTKKRNLPLLKFEINDVKKNLQQKNIKIKHKEKRAKKNSNEGINQDERIFNETSSPLNKIKKTDLPPEICPLEINSPVSDLIIILDSNEWKALLKPAPLLTFQKKIEFLKEQLTRVENFIAEDESPTQWWEAWLEISPPCEKSSSDKSLQVILVEDQYDSNTFPENEISEFSDKKNNGEKKQKYFFITIFNGTDTEREKPVYVFRISLDGSLAELVHIQAVEDLLSGSQMRDLVHTPLHDYLQPALSILNDDAKVDAQLSEKEKVQLNLRLLRGGSSWYESMGYIPLTCKKKNFNSEKCLTQSPTYYYAAEEKIKTLTLGHIQKFLLKECKKEKKQLKKLTGKYLGFSNENQTTFMQLISKISSSGRQEKNLKKRTQANKDLIYLYEEFLTPYEMDSSHSLEQKIYNLALSILNETRIFIKNANPSEKDLTYAQFMEKRHVKFDDLVGKIVKKEGISLWDDLLPFLKI